ncbi:hypothetical protein BH10CYA1_BH10CYA1_05930 [soil metagenome]
MRKPLLSSKIRRVSGTSLLELLVAVVVTGVAIAGITEMLWINATWSTRILNKTDNLNSLKFFLERFESDVRTSRNIGDAANLATNFQKGTYSFAQNATTLILQKPLFDSNGNPIKVTGSPTNICDVDTIVYQLTPDARDGSGSTYQLLKYVFRGQSDSTAGDVIAQVVLSDITGPVDKTTGQVLWFDLIDANGLAISPSSFLPVGAGFLVARGVSSIVADLQVNRTGASNTQIDKNTTDRSNVVVRSETFMRNRLLP